MTKNLRHFLFLGLALWVGAGVFSCKKKEDTTTTLEYLKGTPLFTISPYLAPGDVLDLVPASVTTDDGSPAGIYWAFSFSSSVRDTTRLENGTGDGAISVTVPDTLNALTVTCAAFAKGYYNSTSSVTVAVVHGQETLSGLGLPEDVSVFEDPRDGQVYPYVGIGGREWFARNLACEGGASFRNSPAMNDVFGRYYSWNEAVRACPEGWRLPDAEDWTALAAAAGIAEDENGVYPGLSGRLMADAYMNETKMWEFFPEVKITNDLLFCAIPVGYAMDADGVHTFYGANTYAVFWTAEEADAERAFCRHCYVSSPDVFKDALDKDSFLAPVRCVRDIK